MLSPHKMYKYDKSQQHRSKVTWGPSGRPKTGCSGSACYEHYNVDWTVHRLAPEVMDRAKQGGRVHRGLHKLASKHTGAEGVSQHEMAQHLRNTSPRWGDGHAPGRHVRNVKARPPKARANVSKKTYAVVGVAGVGVAAGAGYYYYRKRKNGKVEKVRNGNPKTHRTFHEVHQRAGVRH